MKDEGGVRPTVLRSSLDPTRARPEPWFVGSGRGLMIGVLCLCAALIVVRAVTILWAAEAAWEWLTRPGELSRPHAEEVPLPAPPRAAPGTAARPIAKPSVNIGAFFGRDDYPLEALRRGQQGRAATRLAIDAEGTPTGCDLVETSGSPSLDHATCAIGYHRLRFVAAHDGAGRPMPSRYDLNVRWVLDD